MKIKLYHGSPVIVRKPLFGVGKAYNDYGQGFYCTESLDLAKEWSVDEGRDGFANVYSLETDGLNVVHLNEKPFCILHWLSLLLCHREFELDTDLASEAREYILSRFPVDISNADAVIGYRADDSYFTFARNFLNGAITLTKLSEAMQLGKLGLQFMLNSKSFKLSVEWTFLCFTDVFLGKFCSVVCLNRLNSEWKRFQQHMQKLH